MINAKGMLITLAALDVYEATRDAFYAKIARETITFTLESATKLLWRFRAELARLLANLLIL